MFDEGTPIDENVTVEDFFTTFAIDTLEPEFWNVNFEAYFGKMKFGNKEKVGKRCKVYEASKIYGVFIEIKIIDLNDNSNEERPLRNAFDLLMKSSTTLYLPEFNPTPRNALDQLKIDLTNFINNNGGGWIGKDVAENIGKKFVTDLANAIWYVDIRGFDTFNQKYKVPTLFENFFGHANPSNYKNARPKFDFDNLQVLNKKLMNYLELPWMKNQRFQWLTESFIKYASDLSKYAEYLLSQQVKISENRKSLTPIVDESSAESIEIIQLNVWRTSETIKKYQLLSNTLEAAELWKPVDVNLFCPDGNRMQRSRYINDLKNAFNFKVVVYIYHHGGNTQNSIFI